MLSREQVAELLEYNSIHHDGDVAKTEHFQCPTCHGGRSGELSFQMWWTPTHVYYKCYRGSCAEGGKVLTTGDALPSQRQLKPRNLYTGDFCPMLPQLQEWCMTKYYHIGQWKNNLHQNSKDGRLVVTLRDEWSVPWGVELKNWKEIKNIPKSSRKYLNVGTTGNRLAWVVREMGSSSPLTRTLFVTEDAPSMYRIATDCKQDAVALLGTDMKQQDANRILRQGYSKLRLCLDPDDAGMKGAFKIIERYAFMFDIDMRVLTADPKKLGPEQLCNEVL